MKKNRLWATILPAVGILLICLPGYAQTPKGVFSVGIKGMIGGNHVSEPDGVDSFKEEMTKTAWLPFEEGGGGTGGGGGIFGEVRFFKEYLGLELDVLFDANKTWVARTQGNSVDMNYILRYTTLRIPLLLKVNFTTGATRFGMGIGPEYRLGLSASPDIEVTDDGEYLLPDELSTWKSSLTAKKRNDMALSWGVSLAFVAMKFEITLDMRVSHVLTWPKTYGERVKIDTPGQDVFYTFQTGHTADGRLMLGIAYTFPRD